MAWTVRDNPLRRGAGDRPGPLRRPVPVLIAVALLFVPLLVFLINPIFQAIGRGFLKRDELSVYWLAVVLKDPQVIQQLWNGFALAGTTTLICFVLAVPLAILRSRCRFRGQNVLAVALLVPLILPPFVGALSMNKILARYGVLNEVLIRLGLTTPAAARDWLATGFAGVAIMQALHLFPILYLNASAALANVDPAYGQAARNLGAGPVRTFFRVTLPLMRPGLFAGGTIVFIWAFTDIGTPLILNYRKLVPVAIFEMFMEGTQTGRPFALVFLLLVVSVLLYLLGKFVFGRPIAAESGKATVQAEPRRLGAGATALAWGAFGVVLVLAILPHVGVVLYALAEKWGTRAILPEAYTLRHLKAVVADRQTYSSILNSLQYAGCATVVDIVLGVLAAWLIIRTRVAGRRVLDAMVMLPLAVPGIILAAGYIAMTAPGTLWEGISPGPGGNPFILLVIAYSVRRLPFMVRGVSAGLEQVPESLEEAARNLGASRTRAAWRITIPLIVANIVAGAVLTFAFAMLEVSDSLVLAQRPADYPITKQIFRLFEAGTGDAEYLAAALGVYGMVLLGGTMALASALLGRRLGTIFRA